jgi:6-phosphogluconolactonase (cycloisomerase 2 family)
MKLKANQQTIVFGLFVVLLIGFGVLLPGFARVDNLLTLLQNVPVEGEIPRNICLDPTGKWLIAAHQNRAPAALFKVDQDSGKLTYSGTKVNVPGSICVRFLALD